MTRASRLPASGTVRKRAPPGLSSRQRASRASAGSRRCSSTSHTEHPDDSCSSAAPRVVEPAVFDREPSLARPVDAHADGSTPIGPSRGAARHRGTSRSSNRRRAAPRAHDPARSRRARRAVSTWPRSSRRDTSSTAPAYAAAIAAWPGRPSTTRARSRSGSRRATVSPNGPRSAGTRPRRRRSRPGRRHAQVTAATATADRTGPVIDAAAWRDRAVGRRCAGAHALAHAAVLRVDLCGGAHVQPVVGRAPAGCGRVAEATNGAAYGVRNGAPQYASRTKPGKASARPRSTSAARVEVGGRDRLARGVVAAEVGHVAAAVVRGRGTRLVCSMIPPNGRSWSHTFVQ